MLVRFVATVVLVEILVIVVSTPIVVVVLLRLILLMLVLLRLALLLLGLATLILLGLVLLLSRCRCASVGLLSRRLSGSLRIFTLSRLLIRFNQVLKVQLLLIIFVFVRVVG